MKIVVYFLSFVLCVYLSPVNGQADVITVHSTEFGKTYLTLNTSLSYEDAIRYCGTKSAHLAKIESDDEWKWIDTNIIKKYGMLETFFKIGSKPVGKGMTPTQWLDGTGIKNDISNTMSVSDCNSLHAFVSYGNPRFVTYPCIVPTTFMCQINQTTTDTQSNLESDFKTCDQERTEAKAKNTQCLNSVTRMMT